MASRREKAPDKRMRKIALVICEGETEENYINLLINAQKNLRFLHLTKFLHS